MRRGIPYWRANMNDPQQHFAAHPYYLMGVKAERERIFAMILERIAEHDAEALKLELTGDEAKGYLRGIHFEATRILNRIEPNNESI